jgi:Ca2+-binding RTX toxin-like protein
MSNTLQAPIDIILSQSAVQENSPNGAIVGLLKAVDPDEDTGETFTYTLLDDAGGRFKLFGPEGHYIQVADGARLDFETASAHTVKVRVTDKAGLSYDKAFTINVLDLIEVPENGAPTDIVITNSVVAENSNAGTIVGHLKAIDPDAGEVFGYELVNNAGGRFVLQSDGTLVVANGALLDYETASSHQIEVRVKDAAGHSYTKTLTIQVADLVEAPENHAPVDILLSNSAVVENSAIGTVVGVLDAIDPDAGETFAYELVGGAEGQFKIVGNQLVVAGPLDYETATAYPIQVRVKDKAGQVYEKTFTVNVLDVAEGGGETPENHAPSGVVLSTPRIHENSASGTVIGTLRGLDPDAGETFTYTLLDDAGGRFKIVGDQVVVADGSKLDFETSTQHDIKVRIKDAHGATLDVTLPIIVVDVIEDGGSEEPAENHAPENLTISASTIRENSTNGSVVGILATFDEDESETFTYQLLDSAGGRFKISGSQIVVADGSKLDYEADRSHTIKVRVTDKGGLSFTKEITIYVEDVANEIAKGSVASNTLFGGRGSDKFFGGLGNDVLKGGLGRDTFVFDTKLNSKTNVDKLVGFSSKDDTIHLSKAIFSKIGSGALKSSDFVIGKAAKDSKDRIVYDKATGSLYYDKDGTGAAAKVKFATVEKGAYVSASDFFVI